MTGPRDTRRARWLVALYPASWRVRYEPEVLQLLVARPPGFRDAVDLARGALDAHLHPTAPSRVPAVAAILAGAAWTVVALAAVLEPAPADWPGYLTWTLLPGAVAAAASLAACLALVLRYGDVGGGPGLRLTSALAAAGGASLAVALLIAALGGPYGAVTGAATSAAGVGTAGLGLVIARAGGHPVGAALLIAGIALVLPPPAAFALAAAAWTAIGLGLAVERASAARAGP